jgi:hypothetical protein
MIFRHCSIAVQMTNDDVSLALSPFLPSFLYLFSLTPPEDSVHGKRPKARGHRTSTKGQRFTRIL